MNGRKMKEHEGAAESAWILLGSCEILGHCASKEVERRVLVSASASLPYSASALRCVGCMRTLLLEHVDDGGVGESRRVAQTRRIGLTNHQLAKQTTGEQSAEGERKT